MKHWTEFFNSRTHATKRLGKLALSLSFEVQEKEILLQNAKANLERFETQILNKVSESYQSKSEFETDILTAKDKAIKWNNEPIDSHIPTRKNKNNK